MKMNKRGSKDGLDSVWMQGALSRRMNQTWTSELETMLPQ